jgi:membrane protein YdbS with pleckstrin-like domain
VAFAALIAIWPFADNVPALAALAATATIFILLIAYEAIRYRVPRAQIRHGALATEELMSAPRVRQS